MPAHTPTIERVEAFVPDRSVTIEDVSERLGLNRHQTRLFRHIHGLDRLHLDPALDLLDLVSAPAHAVLQSSTDHSAIRYLIYAHTAPDVAPSHINFAYMLSRRLGLHQAEAFAVTQQNCASGLAAVDIAAELLRADGDPGSRALVVTGEKPASSLLGVIANTTIMGEASAACLIGLNGTGRPVRSYVVNTMGQYAELFRPTPAMATEFFETYTSNVVTTLREAIALAGLTPDDITMVLPHNVNHSSWRRVMIEFGFSADRIYLDNVPRYGHCFCSDPFLNLVSLRDEGRLTDEGNYLLATVGLGATYAAMVLGGRRTP